MTFNYKPRGVCTSNIALEIEDDIIVDAVFSGGCPGNLFGISKLIKGMKVSDVIEQFDGVTCGNRPTSCPDQLAQALKSVKN